LLGRALVVRFAGPGNPARLWPSRAIRAHIAPMRTVLGCLILLATLLPARAAPLPGLPPSALCEQAITAAELHGQTPPGMLAAIAHVESGRPDSDTGAIRPWPWTINVGGVGQFFSTKAQAIAAVAALQAQGIRSIDVGCMQVNLLWHPDAFFTLDAAFDPATNAAYAVRFLRELYAQTGTWPKSVAAYHSSTPDLAADYQRRVLALWQPPTVPAPPANQITRDAAGGLITGTFVNTGRVYGLILPSVRIGGALPGAASP
jgi:hypothetical protein